MGRTAAVLDESGTAYAVTNCGLLRLDDAGQLVWRSNFDDRTVDAVIVDSAGGLIGAGTIDNPDGRDPYVVMGFTDDGEIDWEISYSSTAENEHVAEFILDHEENAIVAGTVYVRDGSNYSWQLGTGKVDANGNLLWFQTFQAGNYGNAEPAGIAVDADDNIVIGVAANLDGGLRAVKYDPEGEELLEIHYESPDDCRPDEDDDDEGCGCS